MKALLAGFHMLCRLSQYSKYFMKYRRLNGTPKFQSPLLFVSRTHELWREPVSGERRWTQTQRQTTCSASSPGSARRGRARAGSWRFGGKTATMYRCWQPRSARHGRARAGSSRFGGRTATMYRCWQTNQSFTRQTLQRPRARRHRHTMWPSEESVTGKR